LSDRALQSYAGTAAIAGVKTLRALAGRNQAAKPLIGFGEPGLIGHARRFTAFAHCKGAGADVFVQPTYSNFAEQGIRKWRHGLEAAARRQCEL